MASQAATAERTLEPGSQTEQQKDQRLTMAIRERPETLPLLVKAFNSAASAEPASRQAREAEILKAAIRRELALRRPGF